jgi:hypothetical protein
MVFLQWGSGRCGLAKSSWKGYRQRHIFDEWIHRKKALAAWTGRILPFFQKKQDARASTLASCSVIARYGFGLFLIRSRQVAYGKMMVLIASVPPEEDLTVTVAGGVATRNAVSAPAAFNNWPPVPAPNQPKPRSVARLSVERAATVSVPVPTL